MSLKVQVYFMLCFLGFFVHCKASFDCNQPSFVACKDSAFSKSFPETENELEIACKNTIDRMQCYADFEEKCRKGEFSLDAGRKLIEYVKGVCRKDHPLYSGLVNNLKCVKSVMDDDVCLKDFPSEETFRNYSRALLDRGINAFPGHEQNALECLMALSSTACRAQEMEKCGKAAVDAFVTVAQKVNFIFVVDECGDKVETYFSDIISVMNGKET